MTRAEDGLLEDPQKVGSERSWFDTAEGKEWLDARAKEEEQKEIDAERNRQELDRRRMELHRDARSQAQATAQYRFENLNGRRMYHAVGCPEVSRKAPLVSFTVAKMQKAQPHSCVSNEPDTLNPFAAVLGIIGETGSMLEDLTHHLKPEIMTSRQGVDSLELRARNHKSYLIANQPLASKSLKELRNAIKVSALPSEKRNAALESLRVTEEIWPDFVASQEGVADSAVTFASFMKPRVVAGSVKWFDGRMIFDQEGDAERYKSLLRGVSDSVLGSVSLLNRMQPEVKRLGKLLNELAAEAAQPSASAH